MKVELLDSHKKKDFLKEVSYLGDFKTNYLLSYLCFQKKETKITQ